MDSLFCPRHRCIPIRLYFARSRKIISVLFVTEAMTGFSLETVTLSPREAGERFPNLIHSHKTHSINSQKYPKFIWILNAFALQVGAVRWNGGVFYVMIAGYPASTNWQSHWEKN